MQRFTIFLLLFYLQGIVAQHKHYRDSVTISEFKKKVILYINPKPDSALFYIKKSFAVVKKNNYQKGFADTEYLLAQYYKRTQQIDSALFYFESSAQRSEKENYNIGAAIAYNGLCRNLYLLAKYEEAESACKKALENIRSESDIEYMTKADTYTALGTIYSRQDFIEKAQDNFLKVDSMHFLRPLRPDVIAAAYQNLGSIHLKFDDITLAESYYLKANQQFEKLPPAAAEYYMSINNVELGKLFLKKGNLDKADSILTYSHTFFLKIKDLPTASEIATTLAQIKLKKKQFESAEALFTESFEFHEQSEFKLEGASNAIELAKLSLLKKNTQNALFWSQKATRLNESIKNIVIEKDLAFVLAKTYFLMRDYRKANELNEIGYKIKDSLDRIQSAEKIREIEGKYQTTQRDKEITLLTSQKALIEQQKKSQRNILIGGLGLTSLAGLFLFILFRNKIKTNTKLRELDALKTNFFANISHEFRTPLTLISSPIQETLEESDLSSEKRSHFEMASRNTHRLLSLVDQLLDLSKIDSGALKLHLEKGCPTQIMAAWGESFSYLAKKKNIAFKIVVDNTESEGWYDKDALQKIVVNLLGNAIKYTPEKGSIEINISKPKERIIFEVRNTGKGLSDEQLQTIFDRFYQADGFNDGMGIGLSLVKELANFHKGNIEVSQQQDLWTIFKVDICADKSQFKNALIISASSELEPTTNINIFPGLQNNAEVQEIEENGLPILLVAEDNQDVQTLLYDTFKNSYQVVTANNGEEGIAKALEIVPDIIVSDVMMPIKDGVALTKTLKEDERTCHIPIILLTAKAGDDNKLSGIDGGADDYITKPFNQKILISKVNNLITLRKKLQARYSQEVILKPKDIAISSLDEQFLAKVQDVLDKNLVESDFSMEAFSKAVYMSRMQLHRKLKALTGLSASEFIRSQRLKLATQLLLQTDYSVSEVGYRVGFNDAAYFTKCFREAYQCTPSEYSKKFTSPKG